MNNLLPNFFTYLSFPCWPTAACLQIHHFPKNVQQTWSSQCTLASPATLLCPCFNTRSYSPCLLHPSPSSGIKFGYFLQNFSFWDILFSYVWKFTHLKLPAAHSASHVSFAAASLSLPLANAILFNSYPLRMLLQKWSSYFVT